MEDLKITLIQSALHWENIDLNLELFTQKISFISKPTDVVILPEMFTTGFSMSVRLAETMEGKTIAWMRQMAQKKNWVVVGSFMCAENDLVYNRLIWMKPNGTYSKYDKHHLFSMARENEFFVSGNDKVIEVINGWRVCPLICYDLRFPEWSRNKKTTPYDILIYIANWPQTRSHPWKTLLLARAIENQSFVVGLNRVGEDGLGAFYSGDSAVINSRGEVISHLKSNVEGIETITLNYGQLAEFRKVFPVLNDAD